MSGESASDYAGEFDAAERHIKRGEFVAALRILEELLAKPFPALDRTVIWVNIAIVNEEMLRFDDALRAYDEAIGIERSIQGYWASGEKGAYLAKIGRTQESLALFEDLLIRSDLKEEDRRKIEHNVEVLKQAIPRAR